MSGLFAGMVYPDTAPIQFPAGADYVRAVPITLVPEPIRMSAYAFLDQQAADGRWWAVGEFRYSGGDYVTAAARRVLRNGRVAVEFGVERDA